MRCLPLLLLALAAAPLPAAVRRPAKPAPPPAPSDLVADRDMVRLLSEAYHAPVKLRGDWATDEATRRVCADSGAQRGDRRVAICTSADVDAALTRIDLHVLEPAAAAGGKARARTAFRGVPARGTATVGFLDLGPAHPAFVVTSTPTTGGLRRTVRSLFIEDGGRLRSALEVVTGTSNRGACAPGPTPLGRLCLKRTVDLTCTLRIDPTRVRDGWYAAELRIEGERGGEPVADTLPLPHDAYGYRVSARALATRACGLPR